MHNLESDRRPSRPVITSLASADAEVANWLRANDYASVTDSDGQRWQIDVKVAQLPHPKDQHQSLWEIRIELHTMVNAALLIAHKCLDPDHDQRLLSILGDEQITIHMRPLTHEANGEDEARSYMVETLPKL